jgi:hypothetical protein
MKRMPFILAATTLLFATLGFAQAAFNGKWRTEALLARPDVMDQITMTFRVQDMKVTGSIARTEPPGQSPVPLEGTVTLETIEFTVKSPDGLRTFSFKGKLKGDEIVFTREGQGTGTAIGFYALGPATFTAKRVNDPTRPARE